MATMTTHETLLVFITACTYFFWTAAAQNCPPGSYRASTNPLRCVSCKKGFYSAGGTTSSCTACSNGRTTLAAKSRFQSDCKYCPAGYEKDTTTTPIGCKICSADQYSAQALVASATCSSCPDGKKTARQGSTSVKQCVLCASNYAGRGCSLCPAGFWSPGGEPSVGLKCKACPTGRTASADNPTATSEDQACDRLKPGYGWTNFASLQWKLCPKGTWSGGDVSGTAGSATCTPCNTGYTTLRAGSTLSTDCKVCLPGYGLDTNGDCVQCTAGFWSAGGLIPTPATGPSLTKCNACPVGTTTGLAGATDASACSSCKPGYGGEDCDLCPKGFYSPGGLARKIGPCTQCPEGFTTEDQVYTSPSNAKIFATSADCKYCEPGFANVNGAPCAECPFGTYAVGERLVSSNPTCDNCGTGYTTPGTGSTVATQCSDCAEGYGAIDGSGARSCVICAIGWYGVGGPKEASTSTSTTVGGITTTTVVATYACKACPAERTTAATGTSDPEDCTVACALQGAACDDLSTNPSVPDVCCASATVMTTTFTCSGSTGTKVCA